MNSKNTSERANKTTHPHVQTSVLENLNEGNDTFRPGSSQRVSILFHFHFRVVINCIVFWRQQTASRVEHHQIETSQSVMSKWRNILLDKAC